jgi:hypothetical protein
MAVFILSSKKETKKVMSFLLAQMKELKKTSTPNKLPPILGSLIDYEGRPSTSKFFDLKVQSDQGRALV